VKTLTRDQAIYAATQAARRAAAQPDAPDYLKVTQDDPGWQPAPWVIDAILTATASGEIHWVVTENEGSTEVSGERYGLTVIGRYDPAAPDAAAVDYHIRRVISHRLGAQRPTDESGTYWIQRIAVGRGATVLNPRDDGGPTVLVLRADGAPTPGA